MKKTLSGITLVLFVALAVFYGRHIQAWAAEQAVNVTEKMAQNLGKADAEDAPEWWVGLSLGAVPAPVRAQLVEGMLGEADGVLAAAVVPGSPAEKAGVKVYDIITLVGTQKVGTPVELTDIIRAAGSEELTFTVIRAGMPTTVKVKPEEMPEEVKQQRRIMQQMGGFQQMAPGGMQIQIPQGAFQVQVPDGGVIGGAIKPLPPGMRRDAVPEEVRKMMRDMLGEDPFGDEDADDTEEDAVETETEAADEEFIQGDGNVEETENEELIIKKRPVGRADGNARQPGRIQFAFPNMPGGMQVGGGVSISKTTVSQLGGKQLQVSVSRKNNDPAEIRVTWGEDEYQTTENDLEVLPEDVRPRVQDMLKGDVNVSVRGGNAGEVVPAKNAEKELRVTKEKVIDLKK